MSLTREQYLLGKLAEEASEIAQIALKTQQFGMDEKYLSGGLDNKERIYTELNDLLAIVELLTDEPGSFVFTPDQSARQVKQAKVEKYYNYSRSLGLTE